MEVDLSSPSSLEVDQTSTKQPASLDARYIKDFPFPASERFSEQNILSALAYTPLDDDLIICSYPKTGTTWVEYIILQILHRGKVFPSMAELNHKLVPFMERTGAAAAERMDPPRFIKYHLPFHLIPYNKKSKYIYVVRNPKDVLVSYYHFRKEMGDQGVPFDDFYDCFMSGRIPYGDYLEQHVKTWLPHRNDPNVLFIVYEKLKFDVKNEILRIARYLGEDHYDALKEDDAFFNEILKKTSFGYMTKNIVLKRPLPDINDERNAEQKTVKFFRKGTPGDWKNYLSPEQSRMLDEKIERILGEGELLTLWKS